MATQSPATLAAVVIGGTGATGKSLVQTLLSAKDKVAKVTLVGRRKVESVEGVDVAQEESEGRLIQHVQDLDEVTDEKVKDLCTGSHVFFNCLGTTRQKAGSAEAFRHIDFDIPVRFAKAAREAGVPHCSVVSSSGAKASSWFLYMKTKGQIEEAVHEIKFPHTTIFRPGFLSERGDSERFIEKVALMFAKGMPVRTLGEALFHDAYDYHTKQGSSTEGADASCSSALFYDNDILRIVQESRPKLPSEQTTE